MDAVLNETQALARALELAAQGVPWGGNPRVGCVLLDAAGRVLAEGYHRGRGTPHAEVDALQKLAELPADRREAVHTAVVTLEPCNHYGLTPPCALALREANVQRVIYADKDPNPDATGGAETLREAGITAITATQADLDTQVVSQVRNFNELWLRTARRKRPWVIAKTAQSLDGYACAADGTSRWITGQIAREIGHRVRALSDAVIIGTGTLLADHPSLSARPGGILAEHQPRRVIIGERQNPWLQDYEDALHWRGRDLGALLEALWEDRARVVLIEGGPRLVAAAITDGLVDQHLVFTAPIILGAGTPAVPTPTATLDEAFKSDTVAYYPLVADESGQTDLLTDLRRGSGSGILELSGVLDSMTKKGE